MPDTINYVPRRAVLPPQPRKARVCIARKPDGIYHLTLPVEDLDYLISLEFERQRQLQDIAAHNDEDAAEIAAHDLFLEGGIPNQRIAGRSKFPKKTKHKLKR